MYKYLEIIMDSTKEVVSRMNITNQTQRQIDRLMDGIEINLNHAEFHLEIRESEMELSVF